MSFSPHGGVRLITLHHRLGFAGAGACARVRARSSCRACRIRGSAGSVASRLAISIRSRTTSRRWAFRSRVAPPATARFPRPCPCCIVPLTYLDRQQAARIASSAPGRALLSGRPTLAWPAMEQAAPCVLADIVALGTIVTGSRGRIRRASSDDAGPSTRADDRLDAAALCFQSCPPRSMAKRPYRHADRSLRALRSASLRVRWRRIVIAKIGAAVLMSSLSSQLVGVNPWPPFTCATVPCWRSGENAVYDQLVIHRGMTSIAL